MNTFRVGYSAYNYNSYNYNSYNLSIINTPVVPIYSLDNMLDKDAH